MLSVFRDHWYENMRLSDKKGLWANSLFRQMAFALISGLSSVFIFGLGSENFGPKGVVGGLMLVIAFVIVVRASVALLVIPISSMVVRRIGYKKSVLLSVFLNMSSFYFLSLADSSANYWWVLVAAFLFGVSICVYWVPFQTMVPESTEENEMGSMFGVVEALSQFGQVIAPLVGVFVVVGFGFDKLFVTGMCLLFFSGIPMLFMGKHRHEDSVTFGEFWRWSREKVFVRLGVASAGRLIGDVVYADLWPVYVFLVIGTVGSIGWLKSVSFLATAVFTYFISKSFDKAKNSNLQTIGVVGSAFFWVMRLMVKSLPVIIMIDTIDRFFATSARIYFFGKLFRRAKGKEAFSFIVYWEVWQSGGVLILGSVLFVWLWLVGVYGFWPLAFGAAAIGGILSLMIEEHQK